MAQNLTYTDTVLPTNHCSSTTNVLKLISFEDLEMFSEIYNKIVRNKIFDTRHQPGNQWRLRGVPELALLLLCLAVRNLGEEN